jgi:hypothetical protein
MQNCLNISNNALLGIKFAKYPKPGECTPMDIPCILLKWLTLFRIVIFQWIGMVEYIPSYFAPAVPASC